MSKNSHPKYEIVPCYRLRLFFQHNTFNKKCKRCSQVSVLRPLFSSKKALDTITLEYSIVLTFVPCTPTNKDSYVQQVYIRC